MHFQQKYLAIESNRQKHLLSAKRAAKTVKTMLFEFFDDAIILRTLLDIPGIQVQMGQPRLHAAMTLAALGINFLINVLLFKNILYHENVMAKLC